MIKFYKTPVIASIVMLFLALLDLPSGYYTLLRIVVCGTAAYLGFVAKDIKKPSWIWALGFVAIVFNPFFPIHLEREIWGFIDVFVGLMFITGIFALSGEGATKSIFKTKAFRVFKKVALIIILFIVLGVLLFGIMSIIKEKEYITKKPAKTNYNDLSDIGVETPDFKTSRSVDGSFIETYRKGEVMLIGNYKNGKADGIWKIYDKYGKLRVEKEYTDGALVKNKIKVIGDDGKEKKDSVIVGPRATLIEDSIYTEDYDIATRESSIDINMTYEDENIKAKLFLSDLSGSGIVFTIGVEGVNKTAIIRNIVHVGLFHTNLKDNYNNLIELSGNAKYSSLRLGEKGKVILDNYHEKPLKNAIYFELRIPRNTIGNLNDINFIFPAYMIESDTLKEK